MLVSILTPIYGVEKYIQKCAISLFKQTYDDIEYIFVNDCTKDNSIVVLKQTLDLYPNRLNQVRIVEHDINRGLAAARNTAINAASGDFVVHVDSDDWVDEHFVERLVVKQKEQNFDIVSSEFDAIYPHGKSKKNIIEESNSKEIFIQNMLIGKCQNPIWGRLIRKTLYTDHDIRVEEGINMSEDLQVVPKLFYYANNFAIVHESLYFYNCTNISSYTASFSEAKARQSLRGSEILLEFFKNKSLEYLPFVYQRRILSIAGQCYSCGRTGMNKEYFMEIHKIYNNIDRKYHSFLPLSKRIGLSINNYFLFCLYTKFISFFRNLYCY